MGWWALALTPVRGSFCLADCVPTGFPYVQMGTVCAAQALEDSDVIQTGAEVHILELLGAELPAWAKFVV